MTLQLSGRARSDDPPDAAGVPAVRFASLVVLPCRPLSPGILRRIAFSFGRDVDDLIVVGRNGVAAAGI